MLECLFLALCISENPPPPPNRFVCLPQSPTPVESPAFSYFRCFLLCFYISLSAPTPPVSSFSQHKLVLLSLPLIPSSIPTMPFSFLLGAIPLGRLLHFLQFVSSETAFKFGPFQLLVCIFLFCPNKIEQEVWDANVKNPAKHQKIIFNYQISCQ